MTKKRLVAIIISSPILLTVLALMVFTSCVGYAVNGKWELRDLVQSWRQV